MQPGRLVQVATYLTKHKLHITELAALPQAPIIFVQCALRVARELQRDNQRSSNKSLRPASPGALRPGVR